MSLGRREASASRDPDTRPRASPHRRQRPPPRPSDPTRDRQGRKRAAETRHQKRPCHAPHTFTREGGKAERGCRGRAGANDRDVGHDAERARHEGARAGRSAARAGCDPAQLGTPALRRDTSALRADTGRARGTARTCHGTDVARHGRDVARQGTDGAARRGAARRGTARRGTARRGAAQHGAARRGTARHSAAQRGTNAARHARTWHGRRGRRGRGPDGADGADGADVARTARHERGNGSARQARCVAVGRELHARHRCRPRVSRRRPAPHARTEKLTVAPCSSPFCHATHNRTTLPTSEAFALITSNATTPPAAAPGLGLAVPTATGPDPSRNRPHADCGQCLPTSPAKPQATTGPRPDPAPWVGQWPTSRRLRPMPTDAPDKTTGHHQAATRPAPGWISGQPHGSYDQCQPAPPRLLLLRGVPLRDDPFAGRLVATATRSRRRRSRASRGSSCPPCPRSRCKTTGRPGLLPALSGWVGQWPASCQVRPVPMETSKGTRRS